MTGKRWFHIAVAILFILISILLLIEVSVIFQPLLSLINTMFIPLLVGGLLYYMALSFQSLLERNGVGRIPGIIIIILIFLFFSGLISYFAVPAIASESQKLMERWPAFQEEIVNLGGYLTAQKESLPEFIVTIIDNWTMRISNSFTDGLSEIISAVTDAVTTFFMIFIFPFFFFFMLKDHEKFIPAMATPFKGNLKRFIIGLLVDIDEAFRAFVESRVMASIVRALILYIGFAFINLDYAILLVLLALVLNVVPFIGPWLTFIIVSIFALAQSTVMMIFIVIIFIAGYYIESRWITPRMVTAQLTIHPLTVITLVVTSIKFAGLWGLILVLPLYAVLKVILLNIYKYRIEIRDTLLNDSVKNK